MQIEKATYSYTTVNEGIKQTKAYNQTVKHKNEHFSKAMELKKVYEYCSDNINRFLFDPDFWYMKDYFRAAYNFKQYTKKDLDKMQLAALRYLQNELTGIKQAMLTGEVNVTE